MRIDVLMLVLGLVCLFGGLWLIAGISGDANRQLREFLAVIFFIMGIYLFFDFASDVREERREQRRKKDSEFDDYIASRRSRRL